MDAIKQAIKDHALSVGSQEACGLVVKRPSEPLLVVPCTNVSLQLEKSFIIKPSESAPYDEAGTIAAVYHSHPKGPLKFSPEDIAYAERFKYELWLYSVPDDAFLVYTPSGAHVPLLGRNFSFGVHDCVSLVDDYYAQVLGIELPPVERQLSDCTEGIPDISKWIKLRELVIVDSLQEHDILLMNFGRTVRVNHAAIYLGDGHMMHQLVSRPSEKTVYGGYWQKVTMFRVRHRTML